MNKLAIINPVKTLILLAGKGTRLVQKHKYVHKALTLIGEHPLLWYSIKNLLEIGVSEFVLVTGYKSRQIHEFIERYFPKINVQYVYNRKFASTNSIYSYYLARNYLKGHNFFRLEGDILYSKSILNRLIMSNFDIVSAVEKRAKKDPEEYSVRIFNNSKISRYGKDIPSEESFGEAKGIEYVSKKGSSMVVQSIENVIKNGLNNEYAEMCYQNLINHNNEVNYITLNDNEHWEELDTQTDLIKIIKLHKKMYHA